MFVVDTTGSMDGAISEAQAQIADALTTLSTRYPDLRFGLAEVRDYAPLYGDPGDAPWTLDLPLGGDRTAFQSAVDQLSADGGGDNPEAYGGALLQADTDPAVGWRPGARRLLVLVADDLPHDNDLNEGIPLEDQASDSPFDTGADPGPDGDLGTADDVDWQAVLARLKADNLPLLFVYYHGDSTYLPYWQHWAGLTGGHAGTSDDGDLGTAISEIVSDTTTACSRRGKLVGIVSICADSISGSGTDLTASGHVVLDGGVGLGDGPITIALDDKRLTSTDAVPVTVQRPSGAVQIGSGVLNLDAAGENEPISAKRLAKVTLSGFTPGPLPPLGGITVGLDELSVQTLYLDDAFGGGVVADVSPPFDLLGVKASGKLAVGLYAGTSLPFAVLGGTVGWQGAKLPGGWKIGALNLAYSSGNDTWAMSGGVSFPFFKGLDGIDVTGALRGGKVDKVGLTVHTRVPLADTGFIFDSFGGELDGLAGGPKNPVKIILSTSGYWGELPKPIEHVFWLKGARLTIDTSGGASLNGNVTLGTADGRFVKGTLDLGFRVNPFSATGSATAEAHLIGFTASLSASASVNRDHFTAAGSIHGSFKGVDVGSADGIISDKGIGAVAHLPQVCIWEPFGGTHCTPGEIGIGATWSEMPHVHSIGSDLGQFKTARAASGSAARSFRVPKGKPFVFIDAVGTTVPPEFTIIPPKGKALSTTRSAHGLAVVRDAGLHSTSVSVSAPRPGVWKVVPVGAEAVQWTIQAADVVRPLKVKFHGAGSRKHPISKKAAKRLRVRWRSHLGRGTRVTMFVSRKPHALGVRAPGSLPGTGSARVPVRLLKRGANYIHLVASAGGVGLDRADGRPIWLR